MNEELNRERCEALAPRAEVLDISPDAARTGLNAIRRFQAVVREVLTPGTDFGTIPGCGDKPTLLKPGAEKIAKLLKCYDHYEFIEKMEDWDKPLFHYLVRCTLSDMATETKVSSGIGEANSYESKHRYRWIPEEQLPPGVDKVTTKKRGGKQTLFEFEFALKKRETAGQYGKPETYWAKFDVAIQNKTARSVMRKTRKGDEYAGTEVDTDTTLYQLPNPDIFDQVNTLVKMAKKRALVDATLSAGRLSELFTQDLEDLTDEPMVVPASSAPKDSAAPSRRTTPADLDAAKAKAEYEASKKKPLGTPPDEFTGELVEEGDFMDEAEAGPEPKGACTLKQLERFGKAKAALAKKGVDEQKMWEWIHKFTAKEFKRTVVETSDFMTEELDAVITYLGAWDKNIDEQRAAKAAKEKVRDKK